MECYLAVDIGASSGRHVVGWAEDGKLCTREVHRFENGAREVDGTLCWDLDALWEAVLAGMAACRAAGFAPRSVGVDTWGVDYVLLDGGGHRLGPAVAYRDGRTEGMDAVVEAKIPFDELYAVTGTQKQPYNTIYQLAAQQKQDPALLKEAARLLMMPDYLHWRLSGTLCNEYTHATTSGLVDARARAWSRPLLEKLGLPGGLFGPLAAPGTRLGPLLPEVAQRVGFACEVVLPASHDTASAFLAVPKAAGGPGARGGGVTLSSGTWSLLGTELREPLITEEGRRANFTNEGGYGGTIRLLKNIMGLWMVQELRRELGKGDYSYARLEALARENGDFDSVVDAEDRAFLAPKSMAEAVRKACRDSGQPVPESPGQLARCIYRSLAACYRRAVGELETLTGARYDRVHIVGGGSRDGYLNQLTADATGLPVLAGPAEGTAAGNLMVQMLAGGTFEDLPAARRALKAGSPLRRYAPGGEDAEERKDKV